jgi:hypothetical protein
VSEESESSLSSDLEGRDLDVAIAPCTDSRQLCIVTVLYVWCEGWH